MDLNLSKALVFFDIESTGLSVTADSIAELSCVKVMPGGESEVRTWRVKPWDYEKREQKPVSAGAAAVNGLKDEDLAACPRFFEILGEVLDFFGDADLGGFNSAKFDLPLLSEEIERARYYAGGELSGETLAKIEVLNLHGRKMVDVQSIYHAMEPRNLKAAYRFYCGGKDFENAHSAEADTVATYEVLKGQLDMYPELKNEVGALASYGITNKNIDYAGRLVRGEKGEAVINFGKHKGKTAREVFQKEPSYFDWVERGDFAFDTKARFRDLRNEYTRVASRPLGSEEFDEATRMLKQHFGSM